MSTFITKLRDKLREYYVESPAEPVIITLPKGSYIPAFRRAKTTPHPGVVIPSQSTIAANPSARSR